MLLAGAGSASAMASGPRLTVPQSELDAAFKCPIDPTNATVTPVMFVTGTGASGDQGYLIGQDAFEAYGHPVCYVNFPDFTTADIQISVQYLVYGLRKEFALAHRKVAAIGISQGGLLPRFALTYWPDLRKKVSDVVAAAGTQHGTNIGLGGCTASSPCPPADWQQGKGSHLLRAHQLTAGRDPRERLLHDGSLADRRDRPAAGRKAPDLGPRRGEQHPHPGRLPGPHHVTISAPRSTRSPSRPSSTRSPTAGKGKSGAASVSRFPPDVCSHPYATGLNEAQTTLFLQAAGGIIGGNQSMVPTVPAEPLVRKVFERVPDQSGSTRSQASLTASLAEGGRRA